MFGEKIVRAWKDPTFRATLSDEEQAALPENPAGAIELTDDELDMVAGGSYSRSNSRSRSPGGACTSRGRLSEVATRCTVSGVWPVSGVAVTAGSKRPMNQAQRDGIERTPQ